MPRRINLGNALRVLFTEGREDPNKRERGVALACDGDPHGEMPEYASREWQQTTQSVVAMLDKYVLIGVPRHC